MKRNIFTTKLLDIIVPKKEDFKSLFLVMKLQTMDLKRLFRESHTEGFIFTESHLKVVLYNLLCSVHFLHSANIVHRDLKPANVLIDQDCNVILCDFGLARSLPEKTHKRSLTTHVASRWYRAPELILDQKNYEFEVDMWSIGCILGELVSFTDPYRSKTRLKIGLPILQGSSCFPMSPCQSMRDRGESDCSQSLISRQDQMNLILDSLGE
jgi:mitogen-activated protein kinase 1/3